MVLTLGGSVVALLLVGAVAMRGGAVPAPAWSPGDQDVPRASWQLATYVQAYAFCPVGPEPVLNASFEKLADLGEAVYGAVTECAHRDFVSGDLLQKSTRGLFYVRRRAGPRVAVFTNGPEHWAVTDRGLVYWIGDDPDPPANAELVPRPLG